MSGTVSTLSSTKGDLATNTLAPPKQPSKAGFDHLDVNRLFKGKTAEPTTKLVAQKHGMQTLGKVLPARRAGGGPTLTGTVTEGNIETGDSGPKPSQETPTQTFQDTNQGWLNQQIPPPQLHQPPIHHPNQIQPLLEPKWNGGRPDANFPGSRFAQEFPSLDAAVADAGKGPGVGGHRLQLKSQDNQYGPGPILRPQTEGSWTQGGSGGKRPSPPNFPPERPPMGAMPGPMPIGQIPPPLGGYQPTFRPNQPNVPYGKPGGSGYYPGGPNSALRFGMPIPPDAPPPGHGGEVPPPLRRPGSAPPPRPTSHFNKPIIRPEELERMDEIATQEGDWASTNDDVDYNKKINFSDDEDQPPKRSPPPLQLPVQGKMMESERQLQPPPPRFLRREEEERDRDRGRPQLQMRDRESADEDWRPRRVDKEKEREHGQRTRDDDWRSGPNRAYPYDDYRTKKPLPTQGQRDSRPAQDFSNTNVPPRFRRMNQAQTQSGGGQRESPSPGATNGAKETAPTPTYKILERKRGESESSRDSKDYKEKRSTPTERESIKPNERDLKDDFRRKDVPAPGTTSVHKTSEPERIEKRITGSWAEEMDEDESLNAISEMRKPHLKEPTQTQVLKKEERRDRIESKRMIKHTKVADMQTIIKEESPPKPNSVKDACVKTPLLPSQQESTEDKQPELTPKPVSAWGEIEKNVSKPEEPKPKLEPPTEAIPKKEVEKKENMPEKKVASEERGENNKLAGPAQDKEVTKDKDEQDDKRGKGQHHPPQRKNSRESRHYQPPKHDSFGEATKDEGKKVQQQHAKSHENNIQHKDHQRGSGDGKRDEKRNQPNKQQQQHKGHTEGKQVPPKVEEGKGKQTAVSDDRRQGSGSGWGEKQQRRGGGSRHQYRDEGEKEMTPKPDVHKNSEGDAGVEFRRGNKSPSGSKRNPTSHGTGKGGAGASRLQGYGPPSDRSPFSSNTNKEPEDERKDKEKKDGTSHSTRIVIPPPTSGPVPLMALGEISPPDLPLRNRHHGGDYGPFHRSVAGGESGRAPPRFQRGFPSSQRERPHKQTQSTNPRAGGKGSGRKEDDSEQDSRWSKISKNPPSEELSSRGAGTDVEIVSDTNIQPQPNSSGSATTTPSIAAPIHPPHEPSVELTKVPTMVFENTKLKMADPHPQQHNQGGGKSLPSLMHPQQTLNKPEERKSFSPSIGTSLEKGQGPVDQMDLSGSTQVLNLPFPKESSPVKLDFGTGFGDDRDKDVVFHQQTTRSFTQVADEYNRGGRRVSPLQSDLPESLQGLRSLWETPPMAQDGTPEPSMSSFGPEADAGFHYRGQCGEKQDQGVNYHLAQMQRTMGQPTLGTNGFQSNHVPVSVSVIAKPVSCGSPNGIRQHPHMKTLQPQLSLESQQQQQAHGPISFSPFGYGANAFGPIGGVPSPPSIYAQKSTPLYQPFNHHESAHVMSGGGRTHSQYGNYTNLGGGAGGNPYGGSLYLQPFENFGPYPTHSVPQQPPQSLQSQSANRISPGPGIIPTSASGHALASPGMMNSTHAPAGTNSFKPVQVRNPNTHHHPSVMHQNSQQPFSQMTHHLPHPHLTPIGPQKTPYSQQPLQPQTQPQLYIPFEPTPQSLMSLGGNYGGMRTGGGPPPSGTPPMPGLSSYYSTGTGVGQGYPQQTQGGSLPGMQVPQSNPHYGIQFQPQYSNSQVQGPPAPNVLGNPLSRPQQHGSRK